MSNETKQKIGKAHKGDKNASWKGEHVGYSGLHKWVTRALGTPQECWNCWDDNKKKYEWCSVKHKYERKKENWVRLCTACHRNYDQNKIDISEAISHQKKLNEKNTT